MSTRTSSAAALLLLAACSAPEAPEAPPPDDDSRIECALDGAAAFARDCWVEPTPSDEGLILTVRHPDGGFRRFVATTDGTGVAPADGAEGATVTFREGETEVAVGADRYRFPAKLTASGADVR